MPRPAARRSGASFSASPKATKARGSRPRSAAADLGLDPRAFVAFGDAENDAPLLLAAGLGIAVGDAIPALRERADVVLDRPGGAAVVEFLLGPVRRGEALPRRRPGEVRRG
jgi:hypothetical protein